MPIRAFRERILQCICFEVGGFLLAFPLFSWAFGVGLVESGLLILAVTAVELLWNPLHDQTFDRLEWRFARRAASNRPTRVRILHAITHEVSSMFVTLPVIIIVGGVGLMEAVAMDLGLCAFSAVYVFVFHQFYDWLRPVPSAA